MKKRIRISALVVADDSEDAALILREYFGDVAGYGWDLANADRSPGIIEFIITVEEGPDGE